ncbi:hypothetical protein HYQ46_005392 [Verticillium longisporum]|nr:hypothetical protein HYQ46_005392 [Verticillium longisporum]
MCVCVGVMFVCSRAFSVVVWRIKRWDIDERERKSITVNGAGRKGADYSFKTSTSEGNRKWTDGRGGGQAG